MTVVSGNPPWRPQYWPRLAKGAIVSISLVVALLSLASIGYLLWFHFQQNALIGEAYSELATRVDGGEPPTPMELANLAHEACVLDTGISNVQSFLQPISATLSQGGWCGNYVRVFILFAGEEGYPANKFHIQSGGRSHTLAEVYYQGKWRIIDPFFNYSYPLPNGEMATYQDLREDLTLLDTPSRGPLSDPRLEGIYQRYTPIFPALYRDAPDFSLGISRQALYHNYFVILSYPLSIFYDGGRRPLLPTWFDRPELLLTYGLSVVFLVSLVPLALQWSSYRRNRRQHQRITW